MSEPFVPPTASEPTGPQMSTAETLTSIFFEPSSTFEALRERPRFLIAGLVVLLLTIAITAALYMRVDMGQFIRERMEQSPNAAQQTEEQREMGVKFGKIIGAVAFPLAVPIMTAAGAGLYLLCVLAFGGSITYKKALSVWTYSWVPPTVVATVVALAVLFLKAPDTVDPEHLLVTNPGAFMSGEGSSKVLVAALTQFDLIRFYGMFLAAVGLRKLGKLSSGSAWAIVIGLWLIGAFLAVGSAAIFGR